MYVVKLYPSSSTILVSAAVGSIGSANTRVVSSASILRAFAESAAYYFSFMVIFNSYDSFIYIICLSMLIMHRSSNP